MRTRSRRLLERALDRALRDPDPVAALRRERGEAADEEVARAAGRLFRDDPRRFVRLFVAFHAAHRPTTFPTDEGRRFERFVRRRGAEGCGRG